MHPDTSRGNTEDFHGSRHSAQVTICTTAKRLQPALTLTWHTHLVLTVPDLPLAAGTLLWPRPVREEEMEFNVQNFDFYNHSIIK